jgi:hypothetical protein
MCTVDPRYRDEVKELMLDFMDETLAKRDHGTMTTPLRDSRSRNTHSTIHYRLTDEDADTDGHHDGAKAVAEERPGEPSPSHHHDDHKGKRKESGEIDEVAA